MHTPRCMRLFYTQATVYEQDTGLILNGAGGVSIVCGCRCASAPGLTGWWCLFVWSRSLLRLLLPWEYHRSSLPAVQYIPRSVRVHSFQQPLLYSPTTTAKTCQTAAQGLCVALPARPCESLLGSVADAQAAADCSFPVLRKCGCSSVLLRTFRLFCAPLGLIVNRD